MSVREREEGCTGSGFGFLGRGPFHLLGRNGALGLFIYFSFFLLFIFFF
jgi:hypothetical protein